MKSISRKLAAGLFFIMSFLNAVLPEARTETFFGTVQTGVMPLDAEYRYPVILYVPEQYKPDRALPLVIVIPSLGEDLEPVLENWKGFCRRKSYILLIPSLIALQGDVPYKADEWLIGIKNDIIKKYAIMEEKIFLVGLDEGADYAAYLGLNYSKEFSAVGLLNGSWDTSYWKLAKISNRPVKQIPFFVSFEPGHETEVESTEKRAYQLTEKGYPVYFEALQGAEKFADMEFKKRMFAWLDVKSEDWRKVIAESLKSPKEKIRNWFSAHLIA